MNQAQLYSKYNSLQKNDIGYVLDNYFRLVKWHGNDSILDVGCGSGDVSTQLLLPKIPEDFKSFLGVDLSEEMVQFANANHSKDQVSFQTMNVASKDIPDAMEENYDHIFSFYCLHWIQEQRQAMENLYKMLRPGGDMLLTFLANNPIFEIYENMAKNPKWKDYMKNIKKYINPYHYSVSPEVELEKLLKKVGFDVPMCKVNERSYTYSDMDVLRKSIVAVNPFLPSIPNNLHNDYLEDYIEEVRKLNFMESNNNETLVKVPYQLFIVYATKNG